MGRIRLIKYSVIVGLCSLSVPVGLTGIASWFDLRTREIPDWIPLSLFGWAVVATALGLSGVSWVEFALGLGIGLAIGTLMYASGGFGGGDAKLLFALGATLGWKGFLVTLIMMGLIGGVMSVIAMIRGKRELAYGPAIGGAVFGYACLGWINWALANHKPGIR